MRDPVLLDMLRVVLISGFFSLVLWIVVYTVLAPWWRNSIGRTLVIKTGLIALIFIPSILSSFFTLSAYTSHVVGWVDVGLIGLVTPVMIWRTVVWVQLGRQRKLPDGDNDLPSRRAMHSSSSAIALFSASSAPSSSMRSWTSHTIHSLAVHSRVYRTVFTAKSSPEYQF